MGLACAHGEQLARRLCHGALLWGPVGGCGLRYRKAECETGMCQAVSKCIQAPVAIGRGPS